VAVGGAVFGGAYTAMSGVLIAWGAALRPHAAGRATAALFVALTAGQAAGALVTGGLSDVVGPQAAFWLGATALVTAAGIVPTAAPGLGGPSTTTAGGTGEGGYASSSGGAGRTGSPSGPSGSTSVRSSASGSTQR